MASQNYRALQEGTVGAESGADYCSYGISAGEISQCSAFGRISRKRKLLGRSEQEACRWRYPNRCHKSSSKLGQSGTREESDGSDAITVGRRGVLAAGWLEMSREIARTIMVIRD
jgi:hypothetical protein